MFDNCCNLIAVDCVRLAFREVNFSLTPFFRRASGLERFSFFDHLTVRCAHAHLQLFVNCLEVEAMNSSHSCHFESLSPCRRLVSICHNFHHSESSRLNKTIRSDRKFLLKKNLNFKWTQFRVVLSSQVVVKTITPLYIAFGRNQLEVGFPVVDILVTVGIHFLHTTYCILGDFTFDS